MDRVEQQQKNQNKRLGIEWDPISAFLLCCFLLTTYYLLLLRGRVGKHRRLQPVLSPSPSPPLPFLGRPTRLSLCLLTLFSTTPNHTSLSQSRLGISTLFLLPARPPARPPPAAPPRFSPSIATTPARPPTSQPPPSVPRRLPPSSTFSLHRHSPAARHPHAHQPAVAVLRPPPAALSHLGPPSVALWEIRNMYTYKGTHICACSLLPSPRAHPVWRCGKAHTDAHKHAHIHARTHISIGALSIYLPVLYYGKTHTRTRTQIHTHKYAPTHISRFFSWLTRSIGHHPSPCI